MGVQYEQFVSKENFILAYQRLKTVKRDEYKEFFYRDFDAFEFFFEQNIEQLICNVKEGIYKPQNCYKYYMPKKKNLARPISMLSIIDQIVYQALANVIADKFHPVMSKYFNLNTFGNIFKKSNDEKEIFFHESWKKQWKKFKDKKVEYFKKGFRYVGEFDIASFYDTIDHNILLRILENYGIESELIDILHRCLVEWTISSTAKFCYKKSIGIPQGPLCSSFFAEVYLFVLDEAIRGLDGINMKYFRYADDISIMAKTRQDCQKVMVYLDLLARDLSLIPQPEKIDIIYIEDINKHINNITAKFSKIAKEYKRDNNILKEKTHNKLKKHLQDCFNNKEMNKTIISFSLFKLNKDEEIKKTLLSHIEDLELFYKGVIYFFNRHYPQDDDFTKHISSYLLGDTVLFQYNKALLFKNYEGLAFDEEIFRSNIKKMERFWIVKYQMLNWLKRHNKTELIIQIDGNSNYYIEREIIYIKAEALSDECAKKVFVEDLIRNDNTLISLHGLHLWFQNYWEEPKIDGCNDFVKRILRGEEGDYIKHIFATEFGADIPDNFLVLCKNSDDIYKEMKDDIRMFISNRNIDASVALMSLNLFHNIIYDVIAKDKNYSHGDYGSTLAQLADEFPITHEVFKIINTTRNERTLAHYKDKNGNPRLKIKNSELDEVLSNVNLSEAYKEIFEQYR